MFPFQEQCGLKLVKELVETDQNLSRIYGFILYTDENPYVAKVLRDDDFWKALDAISGSNWPIFAARPLKKGKEYVKGGSPDSIGYMCHVWDEPSSNVPILEDFGLSNSKELPVFVAFIWDDNDDLNEIVIPFKEEDENSVYHSIKEIVKLISETEAKVLPEYKRTVNVFRNVVEQLEAYQFRNTVIKRGKAILRYSEFFSSFF